MAIQTFFQAGNSVVVAVPKSLMRELNIKVGQQVEVEKIPDVDAFVVRKKTKKIKGKVELEFKKWLETFVKEDAKLLDELAVR
ncbi:MAG: hypothetical protein AAB874_06860 [Patescibacteria group bacterium]